MKNGDYRNTDKIVYNPKMPKPWGVVRGIGRIDYFPTKEAAKKASIILSYKDFKDKNKDALKRSDYPLYDKETLEKMAKNMGLTDKNQ